MFIQGIIAIIQIGFLPGLIFNRFYKIRGEFFFRLSSIFAISLILNYLIVYILAILKIYSRPVMTIVIFLEVIALIWLYRYVFWVTLDQFAELIMSKLKKSIVEISKLFLSEQFTPSLLLLRQILQAIIFGIAISLVVWFIRRLLTDIGTVFNTWDAVVAWNSWAQTWATNQIPVNTGMYPQLLPANLSITYLLMANTEVVIFAKAIMPLFSTMIILTLLELSIDQKKTGYLIAIIVSYYLFKKFTGDILFDGYADIPVTFMVFMAFVQLFIHPDLALNKKDLFLGGFFAIGAALTKQVGFYCLGIYPIIAFLSTAKYSKEKLNNVLLCFGMTILTTTILYLPNFILIVKDFTNANLYALSDVAAHTYNNISLFQRIVQSFLSLSKYLAVYLITIPFLFLVERRFRLIIALFILPYAILWSIISSYDYRNLAITFPIVAVIVGLGTERVMDLIFQILSNIKAGKLLFVSLIGFVIVLLIGISFFVTNQKILSSQRAEQRLIFSPEINEQIYEIPFEKGSCYKILTNYPLNFLPGLEENQVNSWFNDYGYYQLLIKDPSTCWVLVPNYADQLIKNDIQANLINGKYTLIFETKNWVPYQLIKIK